MTNGVKSLVRIAFCHPPGAPQHAAVAAWARTLAQEQPLVRVVVMEVADDLAETVVAQELLQATEAGALQLGVGIRRTFSIEPWSGPLAAKVNPPKRGGVYLVTGGLGGVGRLLALHLARTQGARLWLMGRSTRGARQEAVLAEIRAAGGEAEYGSGDVSKRDDVVLAVTACRQRFGGIDGVVHAAGLLRDNFILRKTRADYDEVIAPKVAGAIWLDEATAADRLSCFVLFSSTAGVWGNMGQADYAFANSVLDGMAARRQEQVSRGERSGPTVSINWPLWADGGMPPGPEVVSRLAEAGLAPLPSQVGFRWFDLFAGGEVSQVLPLWGERNKVFELFVRTPEPAVTETGSNARVSMEQVKTYLRTTLGEVIQMPAEQIDDEQRFDEMGVDSIVVNDVNQRFERDLGNVPKTLLFEHANIRKLARHLVAHHGIAMARLGGDVVQPDSVASKAINEVNPPSEPSPSPGDIAIVGMAARLPGAPDADSFWEVLKDARNCVSEVPATRWNLDEFYDANPERAIDGKMYGRWGAFLEDVDKFDPLFFNLSPVEAEMMDPQERLFLEVAWHALEDAGMPRRELRRRVRPEYATNVGVFVGVTSNSYTLLGHENGGARAAPTTLPWSLANRVSYLFNFNGPSMPVDTACSSSLTAIHMAVEAIRRGECQQAIAGGVNLYLHPSKYSHLSLMKMLSTDGKCRAFGEGGDGFVPGEGVAALLLKPLALAQADGDRIHGVIKATAVNHGGRTNGYSVPSPAAQASLITQALKAGSIDPASISYLETHGTGTALGDPIEVEGLNRAWAGAAKTGASCAIGSVKTNIGHLESASGVAGVVKVLLQMRHRQLAPSLHAAPPNSRIDFAATPFRVQTSLGPWQTAEKEGQSWPRRAGVSSFGAGGSNAHVILEEPPPVVEVLQDAGDLKVSAEWIVLSAKNSERLRALAGRLHTFLVESPAAPRSLGAIAWTLQFGREALEERVAFPARDRAALLEGLAAISAGKDVGELRGRVKRERAQAGNTDDTILERFTVGEGRAAAARWVAGADIDWQSLGGEDAPPMRVGLPGYGFARERYWIPSLPLQTESKAKVLRIETRDGEKVVHLASHEPVLAHHVVRGHAILPGAATLSLAHGVLPPGNGWTLRNVVWQRPIIGDATGVSVRIKWHRQDEIWRFELTGENEDEPWMLGTALPMREDPPVAVDLVSLRSRCQETIAATALYEGFAARGIAYGAAFQVVQDVRYNTMEAVAELRLPDLWDGSDDLLPPAFLDGAMQCLGVIGAGRDGLEIPFSVAEVLVHARCPRTCSVHVQRLTNMTAPQYNLRLLTSEGQVAIELRGVCVRLVEKERGQLLTGSMTWSPAPRETVAFSGSVLVFDDDSRELQVTQHPEANLCRVVPGPEYGRTQATITLRPEVEADYARLLNEVKADAVVFGWRLAGNPSDEVLPARVAAFHRLVRSILRSDRRSTPLAFVYPGGSPVDEGVGGYVRCVRREHPGWKLFTVGCDSPPELDDVLNDFGGESADLRYRGTKRDQFGLSELMPFATGIQTVDDSKPGGVYVITGGLGGLGRHVAKHLTRDPRVRVVLASRSVPSPEQADWLEQAAGA